jgi:hypothetical protein
LLSSSNIVSEFDHWISLVATDFMHAHIYEIYIADASASTSSITVYKVQSLSHTNG